MDMRADSMMGILPETLRNHPSRHTDGPSDPFVCRHQRRSDPGYANALRTTGSHRCPGRTGWLGGADQCGPYRQHKHSLCRKTRGKKTIHPLGAGRGPGGGMSQLPRRFVGLQAIADYIQADTRRVDLGEAFIQAVPLKRLFEVVQELIKKDPLALLCERTDCERCNAVRNTL